MGVIEKVRGAAGTTVGCVGMVVWALSGLICFVVALWVLFETFGAWTILIALFVAPITYLASFFIVWFTTGVFPVLMLIPYVLSFGGMVLAAIGGKISGEE
jgi:hypothetical protein